MANEMMIPILPTRSINETLEFYQALGFEVTYRQEKPNTYAAVQREGIHLHFFVLSQLDPTQSYSTCLVVVSDAAALRQSFAEALRRHYGKLPISGVPRMLRLHDKADGGRGFNMIDPGGNWIRFSEIAKAEAPDTGETSKLLRAIRSAALVAESKGDAQTAAIILDKALAKDEPAPVTHRVQALIARAGLAISLDDQTLGRKLLSAARAIPLDAAQQATLLEDLRYADELEQILG